MRKMIESIDYFLDRPPVQVGTIGFWFICVMTVIATVVYRGAN